MVILSISLSFTIPSIQSVASKSSSRKLDTRPTDKLFPQLLMATIIPFGDAVTTQELAAGLQAGFPLMPRYYCGRNAHFRNHYLPNSPNS
jgi:hypothetical protein